MKEGREPELLRVDTEPDPLSAQRGHVGRRGPAARSGSGIQAKEAGSARRLAWLLGFCLPLSGGLPLNEWIHGYPNEFTVIRLVTFASLVWLVRSPDRKPLPRSSRAMIQTLLAVLAYAMLSLVWTPHVTEGVHDVITVGMALATGIVLLLLVSADRRGLAAFVTGVLLAGGLQVVLASIEVLTGYHVPSHFAAAYLEQWGISNVETVFGRVAWGTMGNPNDLGGFWLMSAALILCASAYGLRWSRGRMLMAWAVATVGIAIGLTCLDDARAFRLGLAVLVVMYLLDRLMHQGGVLRVPVMLLIGCVGLAVSVVVGPSALERITRSGGSDAFRLDLLATGFRTMLLTGGFGRGIGTERAMIDSGEIPMNFHNVVIQLGAELGLVVAAVFLAYLLALLFSWALGSRSARVIGRGPALARATLAVSLLVYGATSSGVLESPHFWAFFVATALPISATHRSTDRAPGGARSPAREGIPI